jgi:hypothetical protein
MKKSAVSCRTAERVLSNDAEYLGALVSSFSAIC